MEKQYKRVAIGDGAFHYPPRVKYSQETRDLVKLLVEESKLSMSQRKLIDDVLDKGESLPTPSAKSSRPNSSKKPQPQVSYPCFWKKRTQEMILKSGAYEREQYRRNYPLVNLDKEKRHLANMMAYGEDTLPTPHLKENIKNRKQKLDEDYDILKELVQGIRERLEFLSDMECLGMGKKYNPIIKQEIAQKIRLIESLDKNLASELKRDAKEMRMAELNPFGNLSL